MDISAEMILALLPLFMVTTLGASTLAVGLVEGLAESTALIVKLFPESSDYVGRKVRIRAGAEPSPNRSPWRRPPAWF
jgi:hypothetical protein